MGINLTRANVFAKKKLRKRAIIIGDGSTGKSLLHYLEQHKQYGYDVVKYINGAVIAKANGRAGKKINSIAIGDGAIGYIDEVFVAHSDRNNYNLQEIINLLRKYAVRLRVVGRQEIGNQSLKGMTMLGEFPLLSVRNEPLENPDNLFVKRWFDVGFSVAVLLLICSWLFPLIALLIKLNSRGPVFFKQERWGKRNRRFSCLKFRSMYLASCMEDQKGHFRQASKGDRRVTTIGRLLRKTNLDELPQFLNVLSGDMSVVGPRPHASLMNIESLGTIDAYLVRHQAKPGITGWAQVNGFRGEFRDVTQLKARVKLDIWYIEHWSFLLDLKIIALTVVKMFQGDKKAY